LNQPSKHNAKAQEIANVCKMHVKIPADLLNVVKNAKATNTAHKP
jgi:hypothetical protein